jgi:HTH-type transcriptional repressor of NAD biosynthesis genes
MSGPKRIVLSGTESTGKTQLAQRLAAHFGEPWSAEYAREFWDAHGGIAAGDLDAIGRGQVANEEAAAARARRVVFCDTDLITCVLWNDLLFPGHCPAWVRAAADERARGVALYLLCDADVPWAPDPQRCFPDEAGRGAGVTRAAGGGDPRRVGRAGTRGDRGGGESGQLKAKVGRRKAEGWNGAARRVRYLESPSQRAYQARWRWWRSRM